MVILYFASFIASFWVLFKSASLFVEGSSRIAAVLGVPKIVVGIVLVSLGTTAPEFGVTVVAAIMGSGEIALGNAVGSVIVDDGVALALAALLAPGIIYVSCRTLKTAGIFLLSIDLGAYLLARNGTVGRLEGLLLFSTLAVYFFFVIRDQCRTRSRAPRSPTSGGEPGEEACGPRRDSLRRPVLLFLLGLVGVGSMSSIVVWAARNIARHFSIPEIIVGATVVALGTSLPEISTCITAARKGEGQIAVGNIIGADILNILWIVGVASMANPIHVEPRVIHFTFPYMILVVLVMLVSLRIGCRLTKGKGIVLLLLYAGYLFLTLKMLS